MSAYHRKGVSPDALSVATADWGTDGRREALPVCLEGTEAERSIWTSGDSRVLDIAREKCRGCGWRRSCVRRAIDGNATGGIYGGWDFDKAAGRREALIWLGDIEATPRRRSPNRRQAAS